MFSMWNLIWVIIVVGPVGDESYPGFSPRSPHRFFQTTSASSCPHNQALLDRLPTLLVNTSSTCHHTNANHLLKQRAMNVRVNILVRCVSANACLIQILHHQKLISTKLSTAHKVLFNVLKQKSLFKPSCFVKSHYIASKSIPCTVHSCNSTEFISVLHSQDGKTFISFLIGSVPNCSIPSLIERNTLLHYFKIS